MNQIIAEYINFCKIHGEYFLSGDDKNANKYHKKIMKIIEKIKISDDLVKNEFYDLMFSENDSVKFWTSTTLLKTFEENAIAELKKLANKIPKNINNSTAEIILESWNKGLLNNIVDWNV